MGVVVAPLSSKLRPRGNGYAHINHGSRQIEHLLYAVPTWDQPLYVSATTVGFRNYAPRTLGANCDSTNIATSNRRRKLIPKAGVMATGLENISSGYYTRIASLSQRVTEAGGWTMSLWYWDDNRTPTHNLHAFSFGGPTTLAGPHIKIQNVNGGEFRGANWNGTEIVGPVRQYGKLYHLCQRYTPGAPGTREFFVNGVNQGSAVTETYADYGSGSGFYLMGQPRTSSAADLHIGAVWDFRLYDAPLSDALIQDMYDEMTRWDLWSPAPNRLYFDLKAPAAAPGGSAFGYRPLTLLNMGA